MRATLSPHSPCQRCVKAGKPECCIDIVPKRRRTELGEDGEDSTDGYGSEYTTPGSPMHADVSPRHAHVTYAAPSVRQASPRARPPSRAHSTDSSPRNLDARPAGPPPPGPRTHAVAHPPPGYPAAGYPPQAYPGLYSHPMYAYQPMDHTGAPQPYPGGECVFKCECYVLYVMCGSSCPAHPVVPCSVVVCVYVCVFCLCVSLCVCACVSVYVCVCMCMFPQQAWVLPLLASPLTAPAAVCTLIPRPVSGPCGSP